MSDVNDEQSYRLDLLYALYQKGVISSEEHDKARLRAWNVVECTEKGAAISTSLAKSQPIVVLSPDEKKKVLWLCIIIAAIVVGIINNGDENNKDLSSKNTTLPTPAAEPSQSVSQNEQITITPEMREMVRSARKSGSKAFIKRNGTRLFAEWSMKNVITETVKGTEVRIKDFTLVTDGVNLELRYEVHLIMNGKIYKAGWVTEADLSNPVPIKAK